MADPALKLDQSMNLFFALEAPAIITRPDGTIINANEACIRLLGLKRHQILDTSLQDHCNLDKTLEAIEAEQKSARPPKYQSLQFKTPSNPHLPLDLSLQPLRDHNEPLAYLIIFHQGHEPSNQSTPDSAPHHKSAPLSQDLELLKTAILGDISGGVIHQINNPLSVIAGFSDLMSENFQNHNDTFLQHYPKLHAHLQRIKDSSDRITKILKYFRNIYEKEHHQKTHIEVNDLVEKCFYLLTQQFFNRNIKLDIRKLSNDQSTIFADHIVLEQALTIINIRTRNVLTQNYARTGGSLEVSCHQEDDAGKITICYRDNSEFDADLVLTSGSTDYQDQYCALRVAKTLLESQGATFHIECAPEGGMDLRLTFDPSSP